MVFIQLKASIFYVALCCNYFELSTASDTSDTRLPKAPLGQRWRELLGNFHCAYCKMLALRAAEVVQVAAKRFSYQVRAGSVFALGDEVYLFEHGWWKSDEYLFWHLEKPHENIKGGGETTSVETSETVP